MDKTAEEIFNEQANFNKWLKELTEWEVDHVLSMMQAYHEAKLAEKDNTKDLLSDIVSWEKDLSEYESLESILRERYIIKRIN